MGKKKSKGKSKKSGGGSSSAASDYTPVGLPPVVDHYVTLRMKLINWTYSNSEMQLRVTTPLFSVLKKLREKHGLLTELRLYKERVSPADELLDEEKTLEELGFEGSPLDASEPQIYEVYYDFKPREITDPLLLVSPRG